MFGIWRYHAVFTDSPFATIQAEEHHRDHAQVEQVFADWTDGPLAHLPSGLVPRERGLAWPARPARTTCCAPPGALASLACAKARGATLRRDLIDVAARTARHGRGHLTLHLPEGWHREQEWMNLFERPRPSGDPARLRRCAPCGPPPAVSITRDFGLPVLG